jgi:hypothetical protein
VTLPDNKGLNEAKRADDALHFDSSQLGTFSMVIGSRPLGGVVEEPGISFFFLHVNVPSIWGPLDMEERRGDHFHTFAGILMDICIVALIQPGIWKRQGEFMPM